MSEVKRYLRILGEGTACAWTEVVRASDFDAQRLRADTAEAELKALKHPMNSAQQLRKDLAAAEQRIADSAALLRSTSARLWAAHLTLNRLIELDPAHGVKLLKDTVHAIAYAHKCIDMPHLDAALNPNPEAESHE